MKHTNATKTLAGKTVRDVIYLSHQLFTIEFTDGSILRLHQASQAGSLEVHVLGTDLAIREVLADDLDDEGIQDEN